MEEDQKEPRLEHTESEGSLQSERRNYNPYASQPALGSVPLPPQESERIKQSGLGIASFIISLASVVLVIIGFIMAAVFVSQAASDPQALLDDLANLESQFSDSMVPIMLSGLSIIASIGIAFVGLILGIIGAFSKNRRKTFAIVGIILNGLLVLGTIGMFILGFIASATGTSSI